jgi:hypothetical protein
MRDEDFNDKHAHRADGVILWLSVAILVGLALVEWWPA